MLFSIKKILQNAIDKGYINIVTPTHNIFVKIDKIIPPEDMIYDITCNYCYAKKPTVTIIGNLKGITREGDNDKVIGDIYFVNCESCDTASAQTPTGDTDQKPNKGLINIKFYTYTSGDRDIFTNAKFLYKMQFTQKTFREIFE